MALTQQFTAGQILTASALNQSSIPVVSSTSDITSPFTGQVIFNTTDTRLWRYTGSAWAKFSGGPVWDLTHNGALTIPTSSFTDIPWDTERVDTDNMHAANSVNVIITTPGLYQVNAGVRISANATGQRSLAMYLNGVSVAPANVVWNSVGAAFATAAFAPPQYLQLAAGDQLKVAAWQNSGGNLSLQAGYSQFAGLWLRD